MLKRLLASIWPSKKPTKSVLETVLEEHTAVVTKLSNEKGILQSKVYELERQVEVLRNTKQQVVFSFSKESFDKFQKTFEQPVVTSNTTPHGTGYLLGIQRVLAYLRDNHVAG